MGACNREFKSCLGCSWHRLYQSPIANPSNLGDIHIFHHLQNKHHLQIILLGSYNPHEYSFMGHLHMQMIILFCYPEYVAPIHQRQAHLFTCMYCSGRKEYNTTVEMFPLSSLSFSRSMKGYTAWSHHYSWSASKTTFGQRSSI